MDVQPARQIAFGDFELDVRAGQLRKHGVRLRLGEQPFQILLMLIEQPGEIVAREEIRERLWPNNTIVEFDHSINAAIRRLRAALGESAESPRYIETIGSRGYRFVGQLGVGTAPVKTPKSDAAPAEPEHEEHDEPGVLGQAGRTISHYRLIEELGSGGMGVVYRAEDLRLGRQVALKFLPDEVAADPVAKQRFERETRAASALNHPNICTIYGVEQSDGRLFLAMELIEGTTLEARLAQGAMPLAQAVAAGAQICAALNAAHRRGMAHRDIKPANVMLTKAGAKVLDFGLAKAEAAAAAVGDAPQEASAGLTEAGTLLGTVQYMSPEQVRGEEADARSDIFSFGLVLYEMLTGRRAFQEKTRVALIEAVLRKDPAWSELPRDLEHTVRKCLAKDPDARWQSAADLRDELEWEGSGRARSWSWGKRAAASAATAAAIFVAGVFVADKPTADLSKVRFTPLVMEPAFNNYPVWAPGGRSFAYMHNGRLLIRTLDSPAATLAATGAISILFSKDRKRVYFTRETGPSTGRKLWTVPVTGGDPQPMAAEDLGGSYLIDGVTLSPDGKAIIGLKQEGAGAFSLQSSSPPGEPWQPLPCPAFHGTGNLQLRFSPNGKQLLVRTGTEAWIVDWPALQAGPPRQIFPGIRGSGADWMPDNLHLLMEVNGDPGQGPRLFLGNTRTNELNAVASPEGGTSKISAWPDGKFLAVFGDPDGSDILEIPIDGSPLRPLLATRQAERGPDWSHKGDRLVYIKAWYGHAEIWVWTPAEDLNRPLVAASALPGGATGVSETMLPSGVTGLADPVFSPDDRRVAFSAAQGGVWVIPATGGTAVPVTGTGDPMTYPTWSPDGEWLAYRVNRQGRSYLEKVRLGDPERPVPLAETVVRGVRPSWSPDGRWISFGTKQGVELISPDGKTRKQVHGPVTSWTSTGWSRDGKTLYLAASDAYRDPMTVPSTVWAIDPASGKERVIGRYAGVFFGGGPDDSLSPSPDGKSLAVTSSKPYEYIYLIEGLTPPEGFWGRLWPRAFGRSSN